MLLSRQLCSVLVLLILPIPIFAQAKGTHYAFLVACSQYDKTQLRELPYTINDIEEFRKALLETGFEEDNIKVLHDKRLQPRGRYLPERAKILKELKLLLDGIQPQDTLVVGLSGHGIQYKAEKTGYFCPIDAEVAKKETMIALDGKEGLFEILRACKAKKKLLVVNACRNDPISDLAQASTKIPLDDDYSEQVPEGIAAIYACQKGQKSYYDPERQRGIFFDHMIRAWKGEYAKNGTTLNLEDVFQQVKLKTKLDADKTLGVSQVPDIKRDYQGEWRIEASPIITQYNDYLKYDVICKTPVWFKEQGPKHWRAWQISAEAGNVKAMVLFSGVLRNGSGVNKDLFAAYRWTLKAAQAGDVCAMRDLGVAIRDGSGVKKDEKIAFTWFKLAAEKGHAPSYGEMGVCYEEGIGVEKNLSKAIEWYQKGIAANHPCAMRRFGNCHEDGDGVKQDYAKAMEWYKKAIDAGDVYAMNNMAALYEHGFGVAKDEKEAFNWYKKAADAGDSTGCRGVAFAYLNGKGVAKNENEGFKWMKKAADLDDANAIAELGECYYFGRGVKQDAKEAIRLFKKAADMESAYGMECLGNAHYAGIGIAQSNLEAFRWYLKAAEGGKATSMLFVGRMYEAGNGTQKNVAEAVRWYRKGAELGNADCQQELTRFGVK